MYQMLLVVDTDQFYMDVPDKPVPRYLAEVMFLNNGFVATAPFKDTMHEFGTPLIMHTDRKALEEYVKPLGAYLVEIEPDCCVCGHNCQCDGECTWCHPGDPAWQAEEDRMQAEWEAGMARREQLEREHLESMKRVNESLSDLLKRLQMYRTAPDQESTDS